MDVISLGVEVQTKGAAQSAQQLGQFTSATKGAAGAADTLEDQLRRTATAQTQVASTARPLVGAMGGVGQAFKNNASGIQNASFQLQDILVQMEMGVPITRTLGQQLPQLLGGFGAIGAVVGLAVGALLTFAPALFDTGEAADDLTDKLDALSSVMQRLNAAQKGQSLADLTGQYGAQAAAAQELLNIQRQIAQIEADRAFRAASGAVVGAMGPGLEAQTFQSALDNATALNFALREQAEVAKVTQQIQEGSLTLNEEEAAALGRRRRAYEDVLGMIGPYRRGLEAITEQFGLTEQSAANLVIQMTAVKEADTIESRVAATQALATAIDEATGGLNMASDEGIKLYNALLEAALAGLDLKNLDLPGALSGAADQAARMADELSRAASNALAASQNALTARREAEIRQRFANDPVGQARALAEVRNPVVRQGDLPDPVARYINSLRGETIENSAAAAQIDADTRKFLDTLKGGSKTINDIERDAARLYESTRTEAERYAAELDKIEALFAVGAINGEVYSRALEDLNAKFDPFTKLMIGVADTIENELNSAFASVLKGTADLGDALLSFASNVLAKVAQDLFAQQFASPISAALTGILGGVVGGAAPITSPRPMPRPFEDGGVFDQSGVTAFAKGGVVGGPTVFPFANGIGLMGEAGPEAIMPLSRGADGKLGVIASGGGAPSVTINNYSGQEATASTDSAGNMVIEIGRAIAQDITSGGPSYRAIRSTFGLSNRLQQRG